MRREILSLVPKRYCCPICGSWHKWSFKKSLDSYDSRHRARLECEKFEGYILQVYFDCDYFYYELYHNRSLSCKSKYLIADIKEQLPRVVLCQSALDFFIEFEFEESDYDRSANEVNSEIVKKEECNLLKEECTKNKTINKEEKTMNNNLSNNFFNMPLEVGPNNDKNIASTIMGIAVKNGESWRIYDKAKKEITDIGSLNFGNLPMFIMPTTKLCEGDLIKDSGEYFYVLEVNKLSTKTLCARTGEMKNIIPVKNILGFSCYSKVVALGDEFIGKDFSEEKMLLMVSMCNGQTNQDAMNQLLPLMLLKDENDNDGGIKKLLLMSVAMGNNSINSNNMNQLFPLLLLKDELDLNDSSIIKKMMFFMSFNGNNENGGNTNNLLPNYILMSEMLDKDDKKTKDSEQNN